MQHWKGRVNPCYFLLRIDHAVDLAQSRPVSVSFGPQGVILSELGISHPNLLMHSNYAGKERGASTPVTSAYRPAGRKMIFIRFFRLSSSVTS